MLKGFVDCEKIGKMWECNLIGIWIWCQVVIPFMMVCFEWLNPRVIAYARVDAWYGGNNFKGNWDYI
jgi:hypothetical protein